MKIIGLINKIYKREIVPKMIKYGNIIWEYNGSNYEDKSQDLDSNKRFLLGKFNLNILSDEVEIIKSNNIGDIYKFCGLDWIIIDKFDNKLKLMAKDVVCELAYSDKNSNNWAESNVRKFLNEDFINELDKSKLIKMRTNYDEDKFSEDYVRIPTLREIEKLPMDIRGCNSAYWTMTSSYGVSEDCSYANVFYVVSSGCLNWSGVNSTRGVRPVILVEGN